MHIGNVYAMLAAWLSAYAGGGSGKVLLRIEDVDGPRALKDADKWIMDDLHWLGLDWDGGPVYQSQRTDIYEEALHSLESIDLDTVICADMHDSGVDGSESFDGSSTSSDGYDSLSGKTVQGGIKRRRAGGSALSSNGSLPFADFPLVYPCFCSRADLRVASAPQEGDRFLIYPGTCRKLLAEHPDEVRSRLEAGARHSLRIAVPPEGAPESIVTFDDRIFGRQRFDLPREVGDTVIRRSDGIFSYQLAVVVDDLLMGVNDIVRGRDLLRSTALQIWIRRALIASGFAAKYGVGTSNDLIGTDNRYEGNRNTLRTNDCQPIDNRNCPKSDNVRRIDNRNLSRLNNSPTCQVNETAEYPAYMHLPLIDDPTGTRLAKRKHSLDIGTLRADGVKPEQIIGYCAWLLGVRQSHNVHMPDASKPIAMSAQEALQCFTFDAIRADKSDRILHPDWTSEFDRRKNERVA